MRLSTEERASGVQCKKTKIIILTEQMLFVKMCIEFISGCAVYVIGLRPATTGASLTQPIYALAAIPLVLDK